MPSPARPERRIAWPLKVFAAVAVAGAAVAAYNEATGSEGTARGLERTGSRSLGHSDAPWAFDEHPGSYTVTYRVAFVGAETTEVVRVASPFAVRTETYRGAGTDGPLVEERENGFGILSRRASTSEPIVVEVPPAVADARPAAVLERAEELELVERRERREVAGRVCQVWRTGAALGGATFVRAESDADFVDVCVDRAGIVLEEWEVADGRGIRHRVATALSLAPVPEEAVTRLPRTGALAVDDGGGSVRSMAPGERPVGPFLEVPAPPAGFEHMGRYSVVPPQAGLRDESLRGKVRAAVTDVYVRGIDVVIVERGGVLDLTDPWAEDVRFPDVDLGVVGTGELVAGRSGGEVRALLGDGRYLRVYGTTPLGELVDLARSLVPVDGGSGIAFQD